MRVVIQRCARASVSIGGEVAAEIGQGLLVLLGIEEGDGIEDAEWLAGRLPKLRIFADEEGKMNRSLLEVGGDAIVVSQFTLHANTKKGNRPSYLRAAHPDQAVPLYEGFTKLLSGELGRAVGTGRFGADMQVELVNDGPVTIVMDSRNREL